MKKHKTTFFMVLFFFIGLLILLYPSLSNLYNQKNQSKAIIDYEAIIKTVGIKDYSSEFEKAIEYNNKLSSMNNHLATYRTLKNYNELINVNNNGMMGYITIDKIKVELPIYHGTDSKILSFAAGHLEGSSLPIGGEGTHSVISAHRGLPSSKLFTDLDKLEIGDTFTIKILNKTLTYEVDQVKIVFPKEIENLKIEKDKDYVTLLTCTPYGINTNRLLVRAHRIENQKAKTYIVTEGYRINNMIVMPILAIPIILILLIMILLKPIEKKSNLIDKYVYPNKNKEGNI